MSDSADYPRLRLGTGLLLVVAVLAVAVAWALTSGGRVVGAVFGWRVAFFALLAVVVLNGRVVRALFRGRAHLGAALRRSVPFEVSELRGRGRLHPSRGRSGLVGRGALVGGALVGSGVLLWLGGLAFAPLNTTGTLTLAVGQRSSELRPMGMRVGDLAYGFALPHEHTFLGLLQDDSGAAALRAVDPISGDSGEYVVGPGEPVLLGPHRVSLESTSMGPPYTSLRLQVTHAGEERTITLRRGVPISVGPGSLELLEVATELAGLPLLATRVRLREGGEASLVWLLPNDPEVNTWAVRGDWVLEPLALLGTERVTLRFTARWVWWYRLGVLGLLGLGAFLLLLVPHRSWLWAGRAGDLELRVWSLNGSGNLPSWLDANLRETMGEEGFEELLAIEAELAAQPGRGGAGDRRGLEGA